MNKAKLYKLTNTIIGFTIGVLACWYLVTLLQEQSSHLSFSMLTKQLDDNLFFFFIVCALMPVNWLLESLKWRRLVLDFQKISFIKAVKSILFGAFLSLITPNRLGEIGGRLIYIEKSNRLKGVYTNTICSFSQLMITVVLGITVLIFSEYKFKIGGTFLDIILAFVVIALLVLYIYSNVLKRIMMLLSEKLGWSQIEALDSISIQQRLIALFFSLLRFTVFTTQFALLLLIFDDGINVYIAFRSVIMIFLISAVIPTAWISDLPVRTSIAYFMLDSQGYSGSGALISSALLWGLNLFLPAVIGFLFTPKVDWLALKKLRIDN